MSPAVARSAPIVVGFAVLVVLPCAVVSERFSLSLLTVSVTVALALGAWSSRWVAVLLPTFATAAALTIGYLADPDASSYYDRDWPAIALFTLLLATIPLTVAVAVGVVGAAAVRWINRAELQQLAAAESDREEMRIIRE